MQINRLFEMLYILLEKEKVSAKILAERFEVSTRTIYRDVEILSSAGIPIFMSKGKGGGISLLPHFVMNKAVLTEAEKNDILTALQAVTAIQFNETDSALTKLGSLFGKNNREWIEVDFSSWSHSEKECEIFNQIKSAILSKRVMCLTYSSGKGEQTIREVEPLRLCFKGMARYLYAYCTLRGDYRFFKLSRIKEGRLIEKYFEREVTELLFKPEEQMKKQSIPLKLRLSPQLAFRVYDEFEEYTEQTDGSFIVQTNCLMGEWLFPYIASFGSQCEVLEPLEVRDAFREELKKMMNNYL